jgi:phospholipid/cholesterol/gamma-HCH transport system permease protein
MSSSPEGFRILRLTGDWKIETRFPSIEEVEKGLPAGVRTKRLGFDANDLKSWDSSLLVFLVKVKRLCDDRGIELDLEGLPPGVRRLIKLAKAAPDRKETLKRPKKEALLDRTGSNVILFWRSMVKMIGFLGEASAAFGKFLTGRASFRRSDLLLFLQECGVQALPIVSLISVLVGLILAFIGTIQLKMFGAQVFVADFVGIIMVRLMGAIMTGIIMAGRTGASFAAQIGTMQVNEEIDALQTFGISPMEFLVLPRMLALIIMMPLLCLYADAMGILGGIVVSVGIFDITLAEYLNRTREAVTMTNLWIGLFHGVVFGILVALAGCLKGMQCGRSASAVGEATTSAVVTGIVAIVVATAIITLVCQVLGI